MNPEPNSETDSIRSDIEMTRRRMDDTVEALGERLRGRHLLDEVIGFFRGDDNVEGTGAEFREKITQSAGKAATAVADTVKKNPLPILMIAAGAAWLAYSATRSRHTSDEDETDDDRYDPDTHYDRPLEYPESSSSLGATAEDMTDEAQSKFGQVKDTVKAKASAAKEQVKEKLSDLGSATRSKYEAVKGRAAELGSQVQDRTRAAYTKTREQVSRTANEHPVELGLGILAAGVIIGLAVPTPAPVHRLAGSTVDRLRNRTRDAGRQALQKGRRVVEAASEAAKDEARSQGLTLDQDENSATEPGNPTTDATNSPNSGTGDPSAARPVM